MASKAIGFLNFKFGADLSGFERAMKKAQKNLKKFGKNVTKAGQNLSRNLTLPILALGAASIKAFDEQAKAEQKLLTSLKGREDIQQRLIEQAKELQKTTLFGDEATIAAQSMLAMMGLTEEEVVKLIPLIQDFATAKGMDLVTAADLVAKSMGSSTNALSRYGIEITGAVGSSERLETAVNQLTEKFEGQAEAAAKVGAGPLIQIGNQLGDIAEELGQRLMPYVTKFVDYLKTLISKFDGLTESQKDNIVKWGLILAAVGPVLIIIGKLAIGIGALIPLLKGLMTFIVANPYFTLAAAIGAVVVSLFDWSEEAEKAAIAQGAINDVTLAANKAILNQQTEVDILTEILKDENSTLEDKEIALNKLKKLAPEYYGKLKAAKLDVIALDNATKDYIGSIKQQALAEAAKQKLVELQAKKLEIKSKQQVHQKQIKKVYPQVTLTTEGKNKVKAEIAELNRQINEITNIVVANEKLSNSQKKVETTTTTTTTTTKGLKEEMKALSLATHDSFEELNLLSHRLDHLEMPENLFNTDPMDKYRGALGMLGDEIAAFVGTDIKSLEEGLAAVVERMGDELAQGADSFQEYADNVKGMVREVIGALISQGVAAAVTKSLMAAGIINPFLIPVVAGLAAGLARTAFNSLIPAFAEGGIVSGPTLGLMGEYPGASSNPEVIAPLDKLKSMIGGGKNIIVEGVIKGNDIFLSNRNTAVDRLRTT